MIDLSHQVSRLKAAQRTWDGVGRLFPQTEAASAICSDTTSRPPPPGVYSDRGRSIVSS